MKKLLILFCVYLSVFMASGCALKNDTGSEGKPTNETATTSDTSVSQLKIEDYFPLKQNVKYIYDGKGNEFAPYNLYIDYTLENKIQQRVETGGTVLARVLELKDGKLTNVFTREEAYYRENFLKTPDNKEEVLLMEPLKKGTTWTLKDSRVRTITNLSAEVTTPAGSFKAIEITTEGTDGKTVDYYAENVGLVKSVFNPGENEISSSLSKIEENAKLTQKVNFYYPNIDDEKIYYKAKEVSFKTNDITKIVLEKAYKEIVSENYGSALTTSTKINSLYLNKDNMVYIDLNSAFLTELTAGAQYEKMILQSIANTFGQYYGVQRVILTIDNKPYESGHIYMQKGEYIKVATENTTEIKE